MNNNSKNITSEELVERYIYAVTKRMSKETRDDIANELRSLIDDMLAERFGDDTTVENVKEVLTELGTPLELFEKYNSGNNTRNCLIGGEHYQVYKSILPIVSFAIIFGMILAVIIKMIVSPQSGTWYQIVFKFGDSILSAYVSVYMFLTVLFELLYMLDIKVSRSDNLDKLPPVPTKDKSIKKMQPICMMCFIVVFLVVFLAAPEIIGGFIENGEFITMLNISAIRNAWIMIIMFAVCGVGREIVKLLECSYNKKVMMTTLITNIASGVLAACWLLNVKIINDEFMANIGTMFTDNKSFMTTMFSSFQYYLLGAIIFALVLDLSMAITKYRKV